MASQKQEVPEIMAGNNQTGHAGEREAKRSNRGERKQISTVEPVEARESGRSSLQENARGDNHNEDEERTDLMQPLVPNNDSTGQTETLTGLPPIMVWVTAPANLPAGYNFVAQVNGDPWKTFTCEVPRGGVNEGEMFWAPLPFNFPGERIRAPFGRWKDGIFGCFLLGCCHPHLWCSLCSAPLQMAQIMQRAQLDCFGRPEVPIKTKNTFLIVLILFISYMLVSTMLQILQSPYALGKEPRCLSLVKAICSLLFTVWLVYSLRRTRQTIRKQYDIPEEYCPGCYEDLCCAFMCTCCTVAQLARHTGEYETYPGVCCTKTGHPPSTPVLV